MTLELETDNTWGLTKCGEITTLLAVGRKEFFLNCEYCEYTFLQLDKFIRHMCENHMLKFNHMESERSPTLEDVEFEEPTSSEEIDDKSCVLKGFERVEIELDSAGMDTTLHMKEEDVSSEFVSEDIKADNSGETELAVVYNSKLEADGSSHLESVIEDSGAKEKQFIIEFINVYRKLPSLWNIKHKHYKNHKIRQYQYDILLEKYREKYPDAHKTDVIKRIKNLRIGYRRELKKNSSKGVSTVYYFNAMDFLRSNELQNSEQPDLDETETLFQVDKPIVKTELDVELPNKSKNSTSDGNETQYKDTVKEESPELSSEQKFIIELIELYRTLPALWDKKCIEYKDRESKSIQYNILLEKYKERYPHALKKDIKRKMSTLRSNVRRELNRSSTTSLYYFNAMRFICNVGPQSQTEDFLYDFDDTQDTSMDEDSIEHTEEFTELDSDSEYIEMSKHVQIDKQNGMDSEQNKKLKDKSERNFIIEFINLYHSLPALWDFNNPSYQNRIIKKKQYEIMLTKYKEIMPNANILDVKKKIATLRSNFQREVKRLNSSQLKEPVLYYYEAISFLRNNYPDCDTQNRMAYFNEMDDISMENENVECTKLTTEIESGSECTILTAERKFIIEFISLYRSLPALWDLNNSSYHDRKIKTKYYEIMLTKYREIMPNATILDVKKKIATLRSNFQREVKRLRTSNLEEPSLYYFNAMLFLRNNYTEGDDQDQMENVNKPELALAETLDDDSWDVLNCSDDDSVSFVDQTDILLYTDEDTQDPIEKKFILELIEVYRSLPALWKNKDKHYHDREMKRKQYEILLGKYREMYPNAEQKDVRSKINNLRNNYYTELKRVGTNGTSSRYYFDALSFLRTNKPSENLQKIKATPNFFFNDEQFIMLAEIYKEHTCLWDEKDIAYRFKNRREEAIRFVCEKFNSETGLNLMQFDLEKQVLSLRKSCSFEKNRKLIAKRKNLQYLPKFAYAEHIEFLEKDVAPFECSICKKILLGPDAFKVHFAAHDGSLPFKCDICGHGFQLACNLAVHLRRHVHDYTFSCGVCNKPCATSSEVKIHMRSHTDEKPFVCDFCGYRTRTSSHLLTHRLRHQKRPRHKCKLCPKTFYETGSLYEHMSVHRNIRDKICEICNKGFTSNKQLRQHQLIHNAEKKYSCKICEKRFAQYAGLSGHMKTHGSKIVTNVPET